MGCTSCINHSHTILLKTFSFNKARLRKLQKRLNSLKPNQYITYQQFCDLHSKIQLGFLTTSPHKQWQQGDICNAQSQYRQAFYEPLRSKWKLIILCSDIGNISLQQNQQQSLGSFTQKYFSEIQLDLSRTFPQCNYFNQIQNRLKFQKVLKKVAVQFPQMGYTQGINFIVGYFMLVGYDPDQIFKMVLHMIFSQEHFLLGLFEDTFPLCHIYCKLFDSLFKNLLPNLYSKFLEIGLYKQLWIFQWFMTYYLYSFPLQIIKDIWDFIFTIGGIGVVYFAVALLIQLEKYLLPLNEDIQIINYFTQLKNFSTFKEVVSIQKVINQAYNIEMNDGMISKQIQQLKKQKTNTPQKQCFYLEFYANFDNHDEKQKLKKVWISSILQKGQRKQINKNELSPTKMYRKHSFWKKKSSRKIPFQFQQINQFQISSQTFSGLKKQDSNPSLEDDISTNNTPNQKIKPEYYQNEKLSSKRKKKSKNWKEIDRQKQKIDNQTEVFQQQILDIRKSLSYHFSDLEAPNNQAMIEIPELIIFQTSTQEQFNNYTDPQQFNLSNLMTIKSEELEQKFTKEPVQLRSDSITQKQIFQ